MRAGIVRPGAGSDRGVCISSSIYLGGIVDESIRKQVFSKYLNEFGIMHSVEETTLEAPDNIAIGAYPNPFNGQTNISVDAVNAGEYFVELYDIHGKQVDEIYDGRLETGSHNFTIDMRSRNSGIYFVTVRTDGILATKRIAYIK
jgi:hypothetical protein